MHRSRLRIAHRRRRPGAERFKAGTRAEVVTEYAIVLAVVLLGVVAVMVLMRGAVGGDIRVLLGVKTP